MQRAHTDTTTHTYTHTHIPPPPHTHRLLNGLTCVQQLSLTPLLTSSNYTPPDASVAIAAATATTYHATLHLTTGVVVVLKCVYDGEVGGWQLQVVREAVTLLGLDSGYHGVWWG